MKLTKLQQSICSQIQADGYALLKVRKYPRAYHTARALWGKEIGYVYYGTGGHVAIAKHGKIAEIQVTWANNRHQIRVFDMTTEWHRKSMLMDAERYVRYMLDDKVTS